MARTSGATFVGLGRLEALLTALSNQVQDAGEALRAEAEIEMTEAKRRTPVDTGALRASGHVVGPTQSGRNVQVGLLFGTRYAVYVHENLSAFHRVGQAKFLESVVLESAPHMASRIARRMGGS